MDAMAALRLQIEWGADEALAGAPIDRLARSGMAHAAPTASPQPQPAPARQVAAARPGLEDAPGRARGIAAAADSPEALRRAWAEIDAFGLAATATSMLFASGEADAELAVIADVPGPEEDASGVAFSGRAGRMLGAMLRSAGLDRRRVWRTLLVPWRPPGGRAPTDTEAAVCLPFLQRHVALLRPCRLVTLGTLPARLLLDRREPIGKLRGRWHAAAIPGLAAPLPLLPMIAPSQLLLRPEQKPLAWADWRLLRRSIDKDDAAVTAESPANS